MSDRNPREIKASDNPVKKVDTGPDEGGGRSNLKGPRNDQLVMGKLQKEGHLKRGNEEFVSVQTEGEVTERGCQREIQKVS